MFLTFSISALISDRSIIRHGTDQLCPKKKNLLVTELKHCRHNLIMLAVLEIPTGPPVRGRQLWRRTGNFSLIFLWFYVYDLRFKTWGPTTFLTEFPTLNVGEWPFFLYQNQRSALLSKSWHDADMIIIMGIYNAQTYPAQGYSRRTYDWSGWS